MSAGIREKANYSVMGEFLPYDVHTDYVYNYRFGYYVPRNKTYELSFQCWRGNTHYVYIQSEGEPIMLYNATGQEKINRSATFPKGYELDNGVTLLFDMGFIYHYDDPNAVYDRTEARVNIPLVDYDENRQYKTIDVTTLENGEYQSPENYVKFSASQFDLGGTATRYSDTFTFPNYDSYFDNDDTRRYPIGYSLTYDNDMLQDELKIGKAYFKFKDKENSYPRIIDIDENGYKYLELDYKVVKDDERKISILNFSLKNSLYVDKYTLDVSQTQLDNYLETKSLFIPVGEYKNLNTIEAKYEFVDVSDNHYTIVHPFTIYNYSPPVGNCQNGQYCIIGEFNNNVDLDNTDPIYTNG